MWLDRIAGHSNPSPVPRRASTFSNQSTRLQSSSSISLSQNDSSASLLSLTRGGNGEGKALKQKKTKSRAAGVADPLEVLNGILQKQKSTEKKTTDNGLEADLVISGPTPDLALDSKPAQLIRDISFEGKSLEEFIADDSQRSSHEQKNDSDNSSQTVRQFEEEKNRFQELHTAITGCDDVSNSVELYLGDFQRELGAVSAEIETLQARSVQLNAMLENRRNVERILGPAVEEISISPKAVRQIVDGPIDINWVHTLNDVDARSRNIELKIAASSSTKAIDDIRPLLAVIKTKVSYPKPIFCFDNY